MRNQKPTFAAVIPLYNKAEDIVRTVQSAVYQTLRLNEIIVVDDGSTDDSVARLKDAINRDSNFSNVRIIQKTNGGVSSARNAGIDNARSSHIAFLDGDDLWHERFIETIAELVEDYIEARAFATNYYKISEEGEKIIPKIRFRRTPKRSQLMESYFSVSSRGDLPFMASSICIEKSLLLDIGGFPLGETMGEDQDVWAKVALNTEFAYSPLRLACYRLDGINRACQVHCPTVECPFSKRLHALVTSGKVDQGRCLEILRYTAAHILHLAKRNIGCGNFSAARNLLQDKRCNLLWSKKLLCEMLIFINSFWRLQRVE